MPIYGLTNRGLAFPQIGTIRKGGKKDEKANRPGQDLTYFRVEFDAAEIESQAKFLEVYKEQPTRINIVFPFDDLDAVASFWLEAYTAGRMIARSDGKKYLYKVSTKTGEIEVLDGLTKDGRTRLYDPNEPAGFYHSQKTGKDVPVYCKAVGRIRVVIPELKRYAYMMVLTTSLNDVMNLSEQLETIKFVNNGRIAGIPLILQRKPRMVSTPNADGSRARREKWLLSIEADPKWVDASLLAKGREAYAFLPSGKLQGLNIPDVLHENDDWTANGIDVADLEDEPTSDNPGIYNDAPPPQEEHVATEFAAEVGATVIPEVLEVAPIETVEFPAVTEGDLPGLMAARKNGAPLPPMALKMQLAKRADYYKGKSAIEGQYNLCRFVLELPFAGVENAEKIRHSVTKYLFGADSMKGLAPMHVLALLEWLKPVADTGGQYTIDKIAGMEANAVWTQAQKDAGQLPLFSGG